MSTGEVFKSGEFVANLLFDGKFVYYCKLLAFNLKAFAGNYAEEIANYSGIVKVCENRAEITDNCTKIEHDAEEFEWELNESKDIHET